MLSGTFFAVINVFNFLFSIPSFRSERTVNGSPPCRQVITECGTVMNAIISFTMAATRDLIDLTARAMFH